MSLEELRKTVHDLLGSGRVKHARTMVNRELSRPSSRSKRVQTLLLDILLDIETYAGQPDAALTILNRKRSLGYATFSEWASASLLTALLLLQTKQWFAARAELTELLRDQRSMRLPGLVLDASAAYVDADQHCRDEMKILLERGYGTEIKRLGIPEMKGSQEIEEKIRGARVTLSSSRKAYQQLVVRALTGEAKMPGNTLMQDLEEFCQQTPVGTLQTEAEKLLQKLKAQSGKQLRDKRLRPKRRATQ